MADAASSHTYPGPRAQYCRFMATDEEESSCRPVKTTKEKEKKRKSFFMMPVKLSFMHALYTIDTRCICHVKQTECCFVYHFLLFPCIHFLGHHWRLIFRAMPNHSLMLISLRYDTTYRQKSEDHDREISISSCHMDG